MKDPLQSKHHAVNSIKTGSKQVTPFEAIEGSEKQIWAGFNQNAFKL